MSDKLPLRSINEIVADLSQPIDPAEIATKKKGGADISYIHWWTAQELLNRHAPGWTSEIRSVTPIGGGQVMVVCRVSIPCAEGVVFREAAAVEDDDDVAYGDTASNSFRKAFKRACTGFGIAVHLYKDKKGADRSGDRGRSQRFQSTKSAPQSGNRPQPAPAAQKTADKPAPDPKPNNQPLQITPETVSAELRKELRGLGYDTAAKQKTLVAEVFKWANGKAIADLSDGQRLSLLKHLRQIRAQHEQSAKSAASRPQPQSGAPR